MAYRLVAVTPDSIVILDAKSNITVASLGKVYRARRHRITNNHFRMPVALPKIRLLFFGVFEITKNSVVRIANPISVGMYEKFLLGITLRSPTPRKNALMKNSVLAIGRRLFFSAVVAFLVEEKSCVELDLLEE